MKHDHDLYLNPYPGTNAIYDITVSWCGCNCEGVTVLWCNYIFIVTVVMEICHGNMCCNCVAIVRGCNCIDTVVMEICVAIVLQLYWGGVVIVLHVCVANGGVVIVQWSRCNWKRQKPKVCNCVSYCCNYYCNCNPNLNCKVAILKGGGLVCFRNLWTKLAPGSLIFWSVFAAIMHSSVLKRLLFVDDGAAQAEILKRQL